MLSKIKYFFLHRNKICKGFYTRGAFFKGGGWAWDPAAHYEIYEVISMRGRRRVLTLRTDGVCRWGLKNGPYMGLILADNLSKNMRK